MRFLLAAITIVTVAQAKLLDLHHIIEHVNNAQTTWKAGHNFAPDTSYEYIKRLMGVKKDTTGLNLPKVDYSGTDIPDEFDARKQWPKCSTISQIKDQGNCGSCWAVAAASAFSDRVCIASNATFSSSLSSEELLSCCYSCGDGCDGGYPINAWRYFVKTGIVTGGDYGSNEGCQPYEIEPCEHHTAGSRPSCSDLPEQDTPRCKSKCLTDAINFKKDHHKARSAYTLSSNVKAIQEDILKNGPAEAGFTVYEDFVSYKSGVYQYVTGEELGGHAVRIIGWGTENNTPYWLVANSWNYDWGDQGLFKIIRGNDDCGFESEVVAGLA